MHLGGSQPLVLQNSSHSELGSSQPRAVVIQRLLSPLFLCKLAVGLRCGWIQVVLARTPSRVLLWHQVRHDVFNQFIRIIFFVHTTGMWGLNSPTRDGTVPSAVEAWSLNH